MIAELLNKYIETQRCDRSAAARIHSLVRARRLGHYYLYDNTGKVKRQIDSGEFVGTGIEASMRRPARCISTRRRERAKIRTSRIYTR